MGLSILIDVNRYVDFVRGVPEVLACLRRVDHIAVPFVALAELRAGFQYGSRAAANEQTLSSFLRSPRVQVLWPDERTTKVYGELNAQLRRAGTPIPQHDLWIAALAIQHGLVLYSRDQHFDALTQMAKL